jgi:hypothetical protein
MPNLTPIRLLGAAALLSVSALAAAAQQSPAPEPGEKPPMAKPEPSQTTPPTTTQNPATPPGSSQAKPGHPLIGLTVVAVDGSKIGDVRAVRATMDGKVTALRVYSGGFLGFGGRIVEIPGGKFSQMGDTVRLSLTAEEVSKLPAIKDAS